MPNKPYGFFSPVDGISWCSFITLNEAQSAANYYISKEDFDGAVTKSVEIYKMEFVQEWRGEKTV